LRGYGKAGVLDAIREAGGEVYGTRLAGHVRLAPSSDG
jgi:hypothetical protein